MGATFSPLRRRDGERGSSIFRLLSVSACVLICVAGQIGLARAAGTATAEILGFSKNARIFAFIQSYIEDGTGDAVAELWLVDSRRNRLVRDPDRYIGHDVPDARLALMESHSKELHDLGIAVEGQVTTPTQPLPEKPAIVRTERPSGAPLTVRLGQHPVHGAVCAEPRQATAVSILVLEHGKSVRRFADRRIPRSRGCPIRYAVAGVRVQNTADGETILAVVVAYEREGFEGADLRFFAEVAPLSRRPPAARPATVPLGKPE